MALSGASTSAASTPAASSTAPSVSRSRPSNAGRAASRSAPTTSVRVNRISLTGAWKVMDGPAATAAIRAAELDAGRNRTPIIALTANVMSHQTAAYIAGGMDEVVAKPIDFKTLLTAIQRQLDGPAADDVGDIAAA